jgi:hypothetical protein
MKIVNIAVLVILMASVFVMNTKSASVPSTDSYQPYDPWFDLDDNGIIDMMEPYWCNLRFGTTGDPINKTALLYNVSDTFAELLARLDSLNLTLADLQARFDELDATLTARSYYLETLVHDMNATIEELSVLIEVLNATKIGAPDADSGWLSMTQGQERIFEHNLSTTDVLVYMIGKYSDSASPYIHQIQYGADNLATTVAGARWYDLTATSIRVEREPNDNNWKFIRLFIWKIPQP